MNQDSRTEDCLAFSLDLNILNHLGKNLYASTPSVITEIIANAWDADSEKVTITLDSVEDQIIIQDNGHGMNRQDLKSKFLMIGYSRRLMETTGSKSKSGKRDVMGRKGIGKLAMFSLARHIQITTQLKGADIIDFEIDVSELEQKSLKSESYICPELRPKLTFPEGQGTRIVLSHLNNNINRTEKYLRTRLARHFGVLGPGHDFSVILNDIAVDRRDSGVYDDLQFLWFFDEGTKKEIEPLAVALASVPKDEDSTEKVNCVGSLEKSIDYDGKTYSVHGFIGTVNAPSKLGKGDESMNKISLFANGRVFQEDLLSELGDSRYFNNYLIGEIHADFLDQDNVDRATSGREAVFQNDPLVGIVRGQLLKSLAKIRDQWDEWRRALGLQVSENRNPIIDEWVASLLDPRDRKAAERLMASITNIKIANDEEKNRSAQKMLYSSAIVGFEKLRIRHGVEKLHEIDDVFSPEFQSIFATIDEVEQAYFYDITRQRLEVILKFKDIADAKRLEKVAQSYLFKHLWLLDPSWDRIKGSEVMENILTDELKRACPEEAIGARLDIAYRTDSGRHVIVELKRPGLTVKFDDLYRQGNKYIKATEQYFREHPDFCALDSRLPPIDLYFVVSAAPKMDEREEGVTRAMGMKLFTYGGLIGNAQKSYSEYLDARTSASRIDEVLRRL